MIEILKRGVVKKKIYWARCLEIYFLETGTFFIDFNVVNDIVCSAIAKIKNRMID